MSLKITNQDAFYFIIAFGICFSAAAVGAMASVQATSFYQSLVQPAWAPPATVFGPVWSILYTMMAISFWLVLKKGGIKKHPRALLFFLVQLVLNSLWSWLFFAWHRGGLAFAELLVMWVFILLTIISFWRIRVIAGALLIPYLLWVTFAGLLNFTEWQLNPTLL